MFGTGVASAHTGVPLHKVRERQTPIRALFRNTPVIRTNTVVAITAVSEGGESQRRALDRRQMATACFLGKPEALA